jgi:hypothetical protein
MKCFLVTASLALLFGCEGISNLDAGLFDAGFVVMDSGVNSFDSGVTDAGMVRINHSLFWSQTEILDDPSVISFSKLMQIISTDNHGGKLLKAWFYKFSTTAHSERALPAQFIDGVELAQGSNISQWNLSLLPFKVTGIHNRIDLMSKEKNHCGEFRVSVTSTDVTLQPFHLLFLFQQPAQSDDFESQILNCKGTANRWRALSLLSLVDLKPALKQLMNQTMTTGNFQLAESVEFTLAPWEWRQWTKAPDTSGALSFVLENPPLFQQLDTPKLNVDSPLRTDFLSWVSNNANALNERTLLIPERFRPQSIRVNQSVPRVPLSLGGLSNVAQFPNLRANLEIVGCAVCHTTDAEFVQTKPDRTVSEFYKKELDARAMLLDKLSRGELVKIPFGPLQQNPKLP